MSKQGGFLIAALFLAACGSEDGAQHLIDCTGVWTLPTVTTPTVDNCMQDPHTFKVTSGISGGLLTLAIDSAAPARMLDRSTLTTDGRSCHLSAGFEAPLIGGGTLELGFEVIRDPYGGISGTGFYDGRFADGSTCRQDFTVQGGGAL
jgi:hypothetical protein